MKEKFKIVKVDYKYCDYLRNFDKRVCYNSGNKDSGHMLECYFQ